MKKWIYIGIVVAVLLIAALTLFLIFRPSDTEEPIHMTKEAHILLSNGQKMDCTVRFSGTLYIDSRKVETDQFSGGYDGGIWINDKKVIQHYVFEDAEQPLVMGVENGYVYLNKDMDLFVARVESALLGLDIEEQEVYVVLAQNTPEQYKPIISAIEERVEKDRNQ